MEMSWAKKASSGGLERKNPNYCYYSESHVWKKDWWELRQGLIWGSVKEKPCGYMFGGFKQEKK